MLQGAGVKVDRRGSRVHLLPMTDKDIAARSAGAVLNGQTLIAKNLKPEADGPEPREVSDSVIPANDEVFDIVSDLVMEIQRNSLPQSWFGYIKSFFW
jgi:hypothetical protein